MIIRSLWHNNNSKSFLWKEYFNTYNNDLTYINTDYSLISTGTERLVAKGLVPPEANHIMRVPYMDGSFSFPIKYGYNLVGREKESGRRVHCMHPHQDFCAVQTRSLNKIPNDIPSRRATLMGTMETVINAIWDSRLNPSSDENILVIGAGLIGATLALTLQKVLDQEVHIYDINPYRLDHVRQLGLSSHRKGPYTICFHTTAHQEGLQMAIDQVGFEGRIVEMSWYGTRPVQLWLGSSFHYDRKQIISSQVSQIPGHLSSQEDYESRRNLAWKYLNDTGYDDLITHEIPFEQAPGFFQKIRNNDADFLGCVFKY